MSHHLHEKAIGLAKEFKRVEAELIDVLQEIDSQKLFRQMGFASLFEYVHRGLELSEGVSYALINVSRKSAQVPELKLAIQAGVLSVSQAKRVTSVITKENASELIEKAKTLNQRELEREVAKINPQPISKERTRYLTEDRMELKITLRESTIKKLKRVQDLESQKTRSASSLEQTLEAMIDLYLQRKDPVVKSEKKTLAARDREQSLRIVEEKLPKQKGTSENERTPISAEIKHRINNRDKGQCAHKDNDGRRCNNRRWLEIHHIRPVSHGGDNTLENLITLCNSHHRMTHDLTKTEAS